MVFVMLSFSLADGEAIPPSRNLKYSKFSSERISEK